MEYQQVQAATDQANAYWKKLVSARIFLSSAFRYCRTLPECITKTRTDADGRYSFNVAAHGEYALVARAQRKLLDGSENYYWIVGVGLNGAKSLTINLANENMTDGSSRRRWYIQSIRALRRRRSKEKRMRWKSLIR